MIFRNDGEQFVQNMVTTADAIEKDPGRPFDYRTEVSPEILEEFKKYFLDRQFVPILLARNVSLMRCLNIQEAVSKVPRDKAYHTVGTFAHQLLSEWDENKLPENLIIR